MSQPSCPCPECCMCSGEACALCGAGLRTRGADAEPCEHDVIDRHTEARALPLDEALAIAERVAIGEGALPEAES